MPKVKLVAFLEEPFHMVEYLAGKGVGHATYISLVFFEPQGKDVQPKASHPEHVACIQWAKV